MKGVLEIEKIMKIIDLLDDLDANATSHGTDIDKLIDLGVYTMRKIYVEEKYGLTMDSSYYVKTKAPFVSCKIRFWDGENDRIGEDCNAEPENGDIIVDLYLNRNCLWLTDAEIDKDTYDECFNELMSYKPDFVCRKRNRLYWKAENFKKVNDVLDNIIEKYDKKHEILKAKANIKLLTEQIKKLEEKK